MSPGMLAVVVPKLAAASSLVELIPFTTTFFTLAMGNVRFAKPRAASELQIDDETFKHFKDLFERQCMKLHTFSYMRFLL
jgi:hypothetical protein